MMAYTKPNYVNSSFYKDTKKVASKSYKAAMNSDKSDYYSAVSEIGSGIGGVIGTFIPSIGASGGSAIGSLSGLALGGLYNLIRGDDAIFMTSARDQLQAQMIANRNSLYGSAETAMEQRNTNLSSLKRLGNTMKQQFDYNYGSGMFDELQGAISQILNISDGRKIYDVLSSLNPDTVVGQLASRLVYNDSEVFSDSSAFTSDDYRKILEETVSLGDLGSEYTKYIVEKAQQSGTTKIEFQNMSEQLDASHEDYLKRMADLGVDFSKMFSDAFSSKIESDIESEMNIGASEAKSSGFKNRNGSASTKYQKVRKDISDVAYLTTIQMYQKSFESQIGSLNISRQKAYYEYQRQILSMQMQLESNINESLNNYIYGVGQGLATAKELEFTEASSIAGAMAYNDQLAEYESSDKKVYDIEGVTGG